MSVYTPLPDPICTVCHGKTRIDHTRIGKYICTRPGCGHTWTERSLDPTTHAPRVGDQHPTEKPVMLQCSCCSAITMGRQWPNRDKGYGLCPSCFVWISEKESPEQIHHNYGVRGNHFDIYWKESPHDRT